MYLKQLDSGSWRVIVKHGGQQRTATAPTRNEAQRLGSALLITLGGGPHRLKAPVGEVLANYVERRRGRWSPGYHADVCAVIDSLPTSFLDRAAASIQPSTIDDLYLTLERRGWTPHRLRRLHEILSAAWSEGRRRNMLVGAPTADVPKPTARRHELAIPSDDAVVRVLAEVDGPERLALRIAATLGIRRGEVVALQWRDVDLDAGSVTIRRALRYAPKAGVVEGDTKTGYSGHRVLALDPPTADLMRTWWDYSSGRADRRDAAPVWVFSDDGGVTPWRPDRLTHVFAAARTKATGVSITWRHPHWIVESPDGSETFPTKAAASRRAAELRRESPIGNVRLHDLRHYVAVSMLQDGEPLSDVAGQLGHTSQQTTATVYAHYLPGRGRDSVERRAARLR